MRGAEKAFPQPGAVIHVENPCHGAWLYTAFRIPSSRALAFSLQRTLAVVKRVTKDCRCAMGRLPGTCLKVTRRPRNHRLSGKTDVPAGVFAEDGLVSITCRFGQLDAATRL